MDDDLCIHDLPPNTCTICLHGPKGTLPPHQQAERVIEARFPGHCDRCGRRIEEGDPIGLVDDVWICCAEGMS